VNGNTPYAGGAGTVEAGAVPVDDPELTPAQRDALRDSVARIANLTRDYLPDSYTVGSEVASDEVTVAVRPPAGSPVSAGFRPEFDDEDDADPIAETDRVEVARGLAASAALQVKRAFADDDTPPTAR
jgi:hypothetical protein